MRAATGAGGFESRGLEGFHDLVLIHVAHGLNAFEARLLDRPEFLEHGTFDSDGRIHDCLLDAALAGRVVRGHTGGIECDDGQYAAARLKEFAAVEIGFHSCSGWR